MPYLEQVTGAVCKNLFLKDKKKKLYLLSCVHDAEVKLNDIAKTVGAPGEHANFTAYKLNACTTAACRIYLWFLHRLFPVLVLWLCHTYFWSCLLLQMCLLV